MPITVYGIGTCYLGKSNRCVRTDTCLHCRRVGVLNSYDTRLWFAVVFIPVIPLGRKRIVDSCSLCRLHAAFAADVYEQMRHDRVALALTRFHETSTTESALAGHATMLAFHEFEKAALLRAAALAKFPNQVELLEGLAAQLEGTSKRDAAAPLHEALLRITPDLPVARLAVAATKMAEGRLDDARSLLRFLEVSGAGREYSLEPLKTLAQHYQDQGRHSEALRLSETLLRENPALANDRPFRAFVKESEAAQGMSQSILPRRLLSLRFPAASAGGSRRTRRRMPFWFFATALLLAIAGLLISNEHFRRNRVIHVVNATGLPVQVQVDDFPPRAVNGLGLLSVSEGRHRLKVTGAVEETHEVELRTGYFDRWLNKPAWVFNPGNEAVLEESTLYYALKPHPSDQTLFVAESFLARPHVDYAFESPPDHLTLSSGRSELSKTSLQWQPGEDVAAFLTTLETDRSRALGFAERRLRRIPEQAELLNTYLRSASEADQPRARAFLESGLVRRPVVVPWHRTYQSVCEFEGQEGELVALYDRFLTAEPANGSLLYLRGRIDPDWERQDRLYRRAAEADPKLPWPWMALGTQANAGAHWDEGLRCLRKAKELAIESDLIVVALEDARLGTGDAAALAKELRTQIFSQPIGVSAIVTLTEAMAACGEPERITAEINEWQNLATPGVPVDAITQVRALGLYHAGKIQDCADRCLTVPSLRSGRLRVQSLLALRKAKDVTSDASFASVLEDPRTALALCLELYLEDQPQEAVLWRQRAARNMESAGRDIRRAGEVLESTSAPVTAELDRLLIEPALKATILLLLAERFPAKRPEYVARAATFNIRRNPPYLLLCNAIERAVSTGR